MTRALRIGRIFGILIEVDYTWFFIFLLVAAGLWSWTAVHLPSLPPGARLFLAALTAALFFLSVVLHELSHSVVAKRFGLGITGITLFLFGGVSKMTDEPKSPSAEFKIAIAGPLTSIALAVLFLLGARLLRHGEGTAAFAAVFVWLGWMNGMLAIFNMLPGFPLDGGRVLRAGLWHWLVNLTQATRIAATLGQGFGILMIAAGILIFLRGQDWGGLWFAFIGWFLIQAAQASYQQVVLRQALSGVPVSSIMTQEVDSVPPEMTLDQVVHEYVMGRNHPAFPVLEGEEVLGLLCLSDIRAIPQDNWTRTTARDAVPPLTAHYTIAPSADAWEAMLRMTAENCGRLLVMEGEALRGIISRTDIMRIMRTRLELGL